jgi:hypothetical protein
MPKNEVGIGRLSPLKVRVAAAEGRVDAIWAGELLTVAFAAARSLPRLSARAAPTAARPRKTAIRKRVRLVTEVPRWDQRRLPANDRQ